MHADDTCFRSPSERCIEKTFKKKTFANICTKNDTEFFFNNRGNFNV